MVQKLIDGACRLFSLLMVICLALMVLMVFGNVVLRYGFNTGITVSEELSRWLFVWMTFLGALVALRNRQHLGSDMLVSRLPVAGKKICHLAAHLIMLFMAGLMLQGGWKQMMINRETTSAVMEVSMAWFFASGVVFAVLAIVIILLDIWRLLAGQLTEDELIGVRESEEELPPEALAARK